MDYKKMPKRGRYAAGWLDCSVQEFLGGFPKRSRSTKYALITTLDSNTDLRSLSRDPRFSDTQIVGKGILVPTASLIENASSLCFGFDEVWFFPHRIQEEKPVDLTIVGPRRIDQAALTDHIDWMFRTRCSLALGDGVGLNLVVKAQGWLIYLLTLSLKQHFPMPQVLQEDGEWIVVAD